MSYNLNRWIGVRIDALGATFIAALATYLIYGPTAGAGNTGFSLNMAAEFGLYILWLVRIFNDFEVQANRCVDLCFRLGFSYSQGRFYKFGANSRLH